MTWECNVWFLIGKVYGLWFITLACGMIVAYAAGLRAGERRSRATAQTMPPMPRA